MATKSEQYSKQRRAKYKTLKGTSLDSCSIQRAKKTEEELHCLLKSLVDRDTIDETQLEKIKVCSTCFSDIIKDSGEFRSQLSEIKRDYEKMLDKLLSHVSHKQEVSVLSQVGKSDTLNSLSRQRASLVQEIEQQLEAQKLLDQKQKNSSEEKIDDTGTLKELQNSHGQLTQDYADAVKGLHQKLWQYKQKMVESTEKREKLYPAAVRNQLEHCIRTSDLLAQMYCDQNQKLTTEIQGMEEKLQQSLEALKVPISDLKSLWSTMEKNATHFANKEHL